MHWHRNDESSRHGLVEWSAARSVVRLYITPSLAPEATGSNLITIEWLSAPFADRSLLVHHRTDGPAMYHFSAAPADADALSSVKDPQSLDCVGGLLTGWRKVTWLLLGYALRRSWSSSWMDAPIDAMIFEWARANGRYDEAKKMAEIMGFDPAPLTIMETLDGL